MDIGGSLGLNKKTEKGSRVEESTKTKSGSSQLQLDQAAIEKLIEDVLGNESGLASIFGGEQTAGIFDSSVAAQASGDLAANLVGELAKLTGKTVTSDTETVNSDIRTRGKTSGVSASLTGSTG